MYLSPWLHLKLVNNAFIIEFFLSSTISKKNWLLLHHIKTLLFPIHPFISRCLRNVTLPKKFFNVLMKTVIHISQIMNQTQTQTKMILKLMLLHCILWTIHQILFNKFLHLLLIQLVTVFNRISTVWIMYHLMLLDNHLLMCPQVHHLQHSPHLQF